MTEEKERMEVAHEPVPGYRAAFNIILAVSIAYLAFIFIQCL